MKFRLKFGLLLCIAMTAVLAAFLLFQPKKAALSQSEQIIRLSLPSDPLNLDPRKVRSLNDCILAGLLFEGLTRTTEDGKTELALAKNVDIFKEGLCYTFQLRESQWSNGEPLTAFDFCNTWKSTLDPKFPADLAYQLYPIKNAEKAKLGIVSMDEVGIYATDSETLVVELEHPTPYFLDLIACPFFLPVPPQALENSNWEYSPELFISNGSFVIKNYKKADHLTLEKNNFYWKAEMVRLSAIDFSIAPREAAVQMYANGKLDWIGSPLSSMPYDGMEALRKTGEMHSVSSLSTFFYRLNTSPFIRGEKNPLSDPKLRRALASTIDRELIVHRALHDGATVAKTLVPPSMGLKSNQKMSPSLEEFEKFKDPLIISYSNEASNAIIAQIIQRQWKEELGIEVLLEAVEPAVYFQRLTEGHFQISAGSWCGDFNDPINFLELFKQQKGRTNSTYWEDLNYIDLLNRSALCKGEERLKLLEEAETILLNQAPIIPIYHFSFNYMKNQTLMNVLLSPTGQLDFRSAYFDPKEGNSQ